MRKTHEMARLAQEADYRQHRLHRIDEEKQRLTQHYDLQLNMPGAHQCIAPSLAGKEGSRGEAGRNVDMGLAAAVSKMAERHRANEDRFLIETLDLRPPPRHGQNRDREQDREW
jgi:hypothetical protein